MLSVNPVFNWCVSSGYAWTATDWQHCRSVCLQGTNAHAIITSSSAAAAAGPPPGCGVAGRPQPKQQQQDQQQPGCVPGSSSRYWVHPPACGWCHSVYQSSVPSSHQCCMSCRRTAPQLAWTRDHSVAGAAAGTPGTLLMEVAAASSEARPCSPSSSLALPRVGCCRALCTDSCLLPGVQQRRGWQVDMVPRKVHAPCRTACSLQATAAPTHPVSSLLSRCYLQAT